MQEDQKDAERHDIPDGEQIGCEERLCNGAMISKLLAHHLTINKPSHDNTREEASGWQHDLGCEEIAEVHQRQPEQLQISICPR